MIAAMGRALLIAAVVSIVGTACGSDTAVPQSGSTSGSSGSTSGIPMCAEPVDQPTNCLVQSPGLVPSFTARYEIESDTGEPTSITLTAVDASQVIEEPVTATPAAPQFRDLNIDGVPELLVPIELGTVNSVWAVWARNDTDPHLIRAGELSASNFDVSQLGEVIAIGRNDAASWIATFYGLKQGILVPIASATVRLDPRSCSVTQHRPLELTQAGLDARFCGDPAVLSIS